MCVSQKDTTLGRSQYGHCASDPQLCARIITSHITYRDSVREHWKLGTRGSRTMDTRHVKILAYTAVQSQPHILYITLHFQHARDHV